MIKSIKLKFGRSPSISPEMVEVTPITVFVGPNNSGKSIVLSEIHRFCSSGAADSGYLIIGQIELKSFSPTEASELINKITVKQPRGVAVPSGHVLLHKGSQGSHVPLASLRAALEGSGRQPRAASGMFLRFHTLKIDGQSRIGLVNEQGAGDLQKAADTSFQVLLRDDAKRLEVRRIIYEAFGSYFVIDPTHLGRLRIRLSNRPPSSQLEEVGIHDEAVRFHAAAPLIDKFSDGVKAFTGMITQIIAGDPSVLLIDEPEAFLHPALSYKLGKEIAQASSGFDKSLFVSTHSPNFVMGCIQSGASVNIIRLTYRNGTATARVLPSQDILRLMRNPLLRSTGVLSALFYEFVVVTESDADRAFYQEVNDRLLRFKPELGIPNCLFLNAQNKQTVQTIVKPLRELGIPAAGVVDVDVLKEGGSVWTSFLASGFITAMEQQSLASLRIEVKKRLEATGKDMKRDGGIQLLAGDDKEATENLLDRLSEYGLFVVRNGELESWLKNLGAAGHGSSWLIDVFEKMGEEPASESYLKPSEGDVWDFIGGIKRWLTNPTRKGIPA